VSREVTLPGFNESITWSEDEEDEVLVLDFNLAQDQAAPVGGIGDDEKQAAMQQFPNFHRLPKPVALPY